MKKSLAALSVLLIGACLTSGLAAPIGNVDAGRKYLIAARDLTPWSTGLFLRSGARDAKVSGSDRSYDYLHFAAYVGYDLFAWITPYVLIGSNNTDFDNTGDDEFKPEFGFGMRLNLLHHDIMDPTLLENTILVNAAWQYSVSEAIRNNDGQAMQEFYATATLSILNDLDDSKLFLPEGIALFLGPAVSIVNSDRVSTKEEYGIVAGLEIYCTKRVSFYLSGEMMGKDSNGVLLGVNLCL
ncbi:MAG: hypothetical protein QME60_05685 [Verrucomicrobiota bacterium]|nr:hypothetical protein [Verrucomicrobiota bacterium]